MTNGITYRLISEMKKFYNQKTSLLGSIKRNVQIKAFLNTCLKSFQSNRDGKVKFAVCFHLGKTKVYQTEKLGSSKVCENS